MSVSIHALNGSVSVWRVVLDAMQPFIEQPEFLLQPKSSFVFEHHPVQLQCQAIHARQIFFNCDNKWVPEQEHLKSNDTDVNLIKNWRFSFHFEYRFFFVKGKRKFNYYHENSINKRSNGFQYVEMLLSGLVCNRWNT